MKRLLAGFFLAVFCAGAVGAQEVEVQVDGEPVRFVEQAPIIVNSRVMIPLRGVFEKMGASVLWHPDSRTVTAVRGDDRVRLSIGSRSGEVNGVSHDLEVAPFVRSGRTLVPLRFISESLQARVEWKAGERTVLIASEEEHLNPGTGDTYTGIVREAGPSIYMQGGHRLEDGQGHLKALLTSADSSVHLDEYVGQRVKVRGKAEKTVEGDMNLVRVESVERL